MQIADVTICSPFRDSERGISAYLDRLNRLDLAGAALRLVWVEGDSADSTYDRLRLRAKWGNGITLLKCDTGIPQYGSIVHPERFKALATVFNAALDAVDLDWSTHVLFLPSDIVYAPDLLRRLLSHDRDIIAPFSWTEHGRLYDTWGFTKDGKELGRIARGSVGDQPIQMDTVGGTVLIRTEVLRAGVRYTPDDVDRGFCWMATERGFTVWADPSTAVYHPPFDPALVEQPRFKDLVETQRPEVFRQLTQDRYGFDCGPEYAQDFVTFWESLRYGQP